MNSIKYKKSALLAFSAIAAGLALGARAEAQGGPLDILMPCSAPPRLEWEITDTKPLAYIGACRLEPLELRRVVKGNLEVDAWFGGYLRRARVWHRYNVKSYSCHGSFLGSEVREATVSEDSSFPVENPNLDPAVRSSYGSNAPMTDGEAQAALALEKAHCEAPIGR